MNYSRQRESILNYLRSTKSHPTAENVYQNILTENPNISLGTVYRNLTLLAETGEIRKISAFGGPHRFDGNPAPHYHFLCVDCGAVLDLDLDTDSLNHINLLAAHNFLGTVEGHMAHFYGKCPACKARQDNLKNR